MNINKQDQEVADYLKDIGIKYTVNLAQIGADKDDWICDKWITTIDGYPFDYHTGIGHRVPKMSNFGLSSKQMVEVKKLKALLGLDRRQSIAMMPQLMQPTGDKVSIDSKRTMDSQRETVTMPPTQASVLYSLLLDASGASENFNNWAADYGYETDSIKARDIYFACQDIDDKLNRIFTHEQREHLQNLLEDY